MNTEDLPSEEEQFLLAIKLSQEEEALRIKKEKEEEENRKAQVLQHESQEKELIELNKVSEKIDNLKLKKEIADFLEPYLDGFKNYNFFLKFFFFKMNLSKVLN